ncbi:Acyl-CoA oxidase [Corynebacterium glyciniphilum AJ 3170]|uniref:Acyl-CoA oxidase n=1 Tax=Corynebacterium glyciniphilum AJ 3170 TaxID=1404245 RepID=X5E6G8_9CORY|nr:Acyl-CoA oxidase [Corynebacterium glyciniphilum AJ 3170]
MSSRRIPGLADRLYADLTAPARIRTVSRQPFKRDSGVLGDAFTAFSMFHSTAEERWLRLAEDHIDRLESAVYDQRVDRVGLSNGLTGLLLLLDTGDDRMTQRRRLVEVLERRVEALADNIIMKVRGDSGMDRRDYSYATGLAGVAHRFLVAGRNERLAQRIADLFADLSGRPFPYGFWTPPCLLGDRVLEREPELSFGARDLGFGMGLAGVVSTLREAATVFGGGRYLHAAGRLVDEIRIDIDQHHGRGVSSYQVAPLAGEQPAASAPSTPTWSTGLPGVESAVADSPWLMQKLYPGLHCGEEYLDPMVGDFLRPGVCNGLAGRLYLADLVGLPDDPRWDVSLEKMLRGYVDSVVSHDPGFWEGYGGASVVWLSRHCPKGYAPTLAVLGAHNSRQWNSEGVGGLPGQVRRIR